MTNRKHPVSLRRRKRRALAWFMAAVALAVIAIVLAVPGPDIRAQESPSCPTDAETPYTFLITPAPTAWARYPVPLDDDLQKYIIAECEARQIDPAIVFAIIGVESGYEADKLGDGGNSVGLMQIQPIYFLDRIEALGVTDLQDPYQNVALGIDYLDELYQTGHSTEWVLMAYNGGAVYAGQMTADGNMSTYARKVMALAEELTEGVQIEEVG